MKVEATKLAGVLVLEPRKFADDRGFFMESFQEETYKALGIPGTNAAFRQDNLSFSRKNVLRGLHFQNPRSQGKLVFPITGEIVDVVVDIRKSSPTFGQWIAVPLASETRRQIWVPAGFAHGFWVTSETAHVVYKCTDVYSPGTEHGIAWDDPELGVAWPGREPVLSAKDKVYPRLSALPRSVLFD